MSDRFDEVLAAFLQAEESGTAPEQSEFIERHPEFAIELEQFFDDRERFSTATDTEPFPPVGSTLRYFGDYELLDRIATGGMGAVYRARQNNLERIVALKVILTGRLASDVEVSRFHAEAEAAARLDHPGIVPIHEIGEHDGQHYFTMTFVDGESLAHRIARELPKPRDAATLIKGVAEAIAYAHTEGVIHRDIKPSNILIGKDDQPRITDFGLARRVDVDSQLTSSGEALGTPSYMPPEQAQGTATAQSDVYSLGATLYCALTGRPPFHAANPIDTLMQVLNNEPLPPRRLDPSIPRDLDTICLKCLEKDPGHRYLAAAEVASELRRWLSGQPIAARPAGTLERGIKWVRRETAKAASIAISLVAIAALLVLGWFHSTRLEAELATSRRHLYATTISVAQGAVDGAEFARAANQLAAIDASLRGFEWRYLWHRSHDQRMTLAGHDGTVTSVRFLDDDSLESIGADGTMSVWDLPSGSERETRTDAQAEEASSTAANKGIDADAEAVIDERTKITLDHGTLRLHTDGAVEIGTLPDSPGYRSLAVSPDRKTLIIGNWGIESMSAPRSYSSSGILTLDYVLLWDVEAKRVKARLVGHRGGITAVVVSPDSGTIATASRDTTVRVWDAQSGASLGVIGWHARGATALAYSPDGSMLASGGQTGSVKLWQVDRGGDLDVLNTGSRVCAVAVSPDGRTVAVAGGSGHVGEAGSLVLFDGQDGKRIASLPHPTAVVAVEFAPSGDTLATASWQRGKPGNYTGTVIRVWDTASQSVRAEIHDDGGYETALAFSPDGTVLATVNKAGVKLWNPSTGEAIATVLADGSLNADCAVAWSADGQLVVTNWSNGLIQKVSREGETLAERDEWSGGVVQSRTVGDNPRSIALAGSIVATPMRTAATRGPGAVRVFSVDGLEPLATLAEPDSEITCLAMTGDGESIAVGTRSGDIVLWDPRTGQVRCRLTGHDASVSSVAFSNNGTLLVSGSLDGTTRIWRAPE